MNRGNTKPAKPSFMQRRKLKNKAKKNPAGEDTPPLKRGAKRKDDDVVLTSSTDEAEETLHEQETTFSDDEMVRVEVNDFYYINPPVETAYNPYNCNFNNNHAHHHHHHNYHNHQFKQHMSWYNHNHNHDYTTRPHSHFNNYSEWMHNPNLIHQQVNPSEPHSYLDFNTGTHSGFQIFGVQPTQTCTCDHNENDSEKSPDDGQFEYYSASPKKTGGSDETILSQKVLKIEEVPDSDEEDKKVKTKKSKKRNVRGKCKYIVEEPTDDEAPKVDEPSSNSCS